MRKEFQKTALLILTIFIFNSCKGQKKNDNINSNQKVKIDYNKKINEVLLKQLKYGKPSYDNPFEYSNLDLEVILPETRKILESQGFKFILRCSDNYL